MDLFLGLLYGFGTLALFFSTFVISALVNSFLPSLPFWACLGLLINHCWKKGGKHPRIRACIVYGVLFAVWLALVLWHPQLNNYSPW